VQRRVPIILLSALALVDAALAGGVAGMALGVEAYSAPEGENHFRYLIEFEIFPTRGRWFIAAAYEVNPDTWDSNRLSLGGGYRLPLADDHDLRLELDCGMTYPLAHDWWGWSRRVDNAWWGVGLDARWQWEFTPGLALELGLRPEIAFREGEGLFPVTALAGFVLYP